MHDTNHMLTPAMYFKHKSADFSVLLIVSSQSWKEKKNAIFALFL